MLLQNIRKISHGIQKNEVSEHQQQWIDLLCTYGNRLEYEKTNEQSKSAMFSIMKYRRLLRSRGLGNVSFIELNTAHIQRNYIRLHSLMQELFLEPISDSQFSYILDRVNNTEDGMLKLYDRHKQDTGTRILTATLTL